MLNDHQQEEPDEQEIPEDQDHDSEE